MQYLVSFTLIGLVFDHVAHIILPGHEGVGIVVKVGKAVTKLKP
jgi:D-arabinose 1-dehydrogenase-like Zn-dependent alcohol dehydrogenase